MTREEAIRILETGCIMPDYPHTVEMLDEALRMAIAALRSQQATTQLDRSRWEGCDWCSRRYCNNCFWQIKTKDSSRCERCIDKSEWAPIVSYCSNCGRPLTEGAWAETESRIGRNDRKETSYA